MSDQKTPTHVVQAMYAAFAANDEPRLRELISEDVEWIQCEGFPGGEHRHGIESVLQGVLRGNKTTWNDFRVDLDEYLAADDRVAVFGSYAGQHSVTGKSMRAVFTHVYDVRDGRIVRFRQYCDTWPMVRAAQPS
ncbi:MAG: nuclear transport factor 2 family protein [Planctomycetes bacterium]|nr:nuclear transport factor 2 family protein [Planctomycetota bacterium]